MRCPLVTFPGWGVGRGPGQEKSGGGVPEPSPSRRRENGQTHPATLRRRLSSASPGHAHRRQQAERQRATSRPSVLGRRGPTPSDHGSGPPEQEGAGPSGEGTGPHRVAASERAERDPRREWEGGRETPVEADSRPQGCWSRGGLERVQDRWSLWTRPHTHPPPLGRVETISLHSWPLGLPPHESL